MRTTGASERQGRDGKAPPSSRLFRDGRKFEQLCSQLSARDRRVVAALLERLTDLEREGEIDRALELIVQIEDIVRD
jgi:hypothetical protein